MAEQDQKKKSGPQTGADDFNPHLDEVKLPKGRNAHGSNALNLAGEDLLRRLDSTSGDSLLRVGPAWQAKWEVGRVALRNALKRMDALVQAHNPKWKVVWHETEVDEKYMPGPEEWTVDLLIEKGPGDLKRLPLVQKHQNPARAGCWAFTINEVVFTEDQLYAMLYAAFEELEPQAKALHP